MRTRTVVHQQLCHGFGVLSIAVWVRAAIDAPSLTLLLELPLASLVADRERERQDRKRACVCVGTLTVALQSLVYTTDPEAVRVCAFGAHARIRERVSFVALYTPGIIYPLAYIETTFRRITTADDHSCVRLFCLRGYCEWILRFVFVY